MRIFDRDIVDEYLTPNKFSKSTASSYRSAIIRFGECIEAESGNEAVAWARFADTRKRSANPQPAHKIIQTSKVIVKNYLWWVNTVYPMYYEEYKAFVRNASENPVRHSVDSIDFAAILKWLKEQASFFHSQRGLAVEEVVRYASMPDSSEFTDAVKRIRDTDDMLKILTDLSTIVEIVEEA